MFNIFKIKKGRADSFHFPTTKIEEKIQIYNFKDIKYPFFFSCLVRI